MDFHVTITKKEHYIVEADDATFPDRVAHAAGRHLEHYPTIARAWVHPKELVRIGTFDGQRVRLRDGDAAVALAIWLVGGSSCSGSTPASWRSARSFQTFPGGLVRRTAHEATAILDALHEIKERLGKREPD